MKNEEDKTLLEFNIKMRCEMLSGIIEIINHYTKDGRKISGGKWDNSYITSARDKLSSNLMVMNAYKNASVFNFINFPDFNGAINSNELEAYLFVYRFGCAKLDYYKCNDQSKLLELNEVVFFDLLSRRLKHISNSLNILLKKYIDYSGYKENYVKYAVASLEYIKYSCVLFMSKWLKNYAYVYKYRLFFNNKFDSSFSSEFPKEVKDYFVVCANQISESTLDSKLISKIGSCYNNYFYKEQVSSIINNFDTAIPKANIMGRLNYYRGEEGVYFRKTTNAKNKFKTELYKIISDLPLNMKNSLAIIELSKIEDTPELQNIYNDLEKRRDSSFDKIVLERDCLLDVLSGNTKTTSVVVKENKKAEPKEKKVKVKKEKKPKVKKEKIKKVKVKKEKVKRERAHINFNIGLSWQNILLIIVPLLICGLMLTLKYSNVFDNVLKAFTEWAFNGLGSLPNKFPYFFIVTWFVNTFGEAASNSILVAILGAIPALIIIVVTFVLDLIIIILFLLAVLVGFILAALITLILVICIYAIIPVTLIVTIILSINYDLVDTPAKKVSLILTCVLIVTAGVFFYFIHF